MSKCNGGCGLLAGIFLIVFTFVQWAAAKWIIFAIGVIMVLRALGGGKCQMTSCKIEEPKKVAKKVTKKKVTKKVAKKKVIKKKK